MCCCYNVSSIFSVVFAVWFREHIDGVHQFVTGATGPDGSRTDVTITSYYARPGPKFEYMVECGDSRSPFVVASVLEKTDPPEWPDGKKVKVGAIFISDTPWNYYENRFVHCALVLVESFV